jgi:Flp pilus assembly protein TadG
MAATLARQPRPNQRGAQLLEFALVLPLLLVLAVGVVDFGRAWNIRQILNNAAREGARLAASRPSVELSNCNSNSNSSNSNPVGNMLICQVVVQYLQHAAVDTSFIAECSAGTWDPCTFTATYYSDPSNGYGLKIERSVPVPGTSPTVFGARVTLKYPYRWTLGFDHVIRLIAPGAQFGNPIPITTDAFMIYGAS